MITLGVSGAMDRSCRDQIDQESARWGYRLVLGREPDQWEIVAAREHFATEHDLMVALMKSLEFGYTKLRATLEEGAWLPDFGARYAALEAMRERFQRDNVYPEVGFYKDFLGAR